MGLQLLDCIASPLLSQVPTIDEARLRQQVIERR